jgi:hypothetical protein
MTITITITTQKGEQRQVEAEPTCSPYFVIHHTLVSGGESDKYTITHAPSAFSVLQNIKGKRKARLCAAVFAGLPVRWDRITDDVSASKRFKKELPKWVPEWRRQVNAY